MERITATHATKEVLMAGEVHSIIEDRKPFAYLAVACPPLVAGLEERLVLLSLTERMRCGWTLFHLVKSARSNWEAQLGELRDRSEARYRTDLRLIGHLCRRREFCGLEARGLVDLVETLAKSMAAHEGEALEAHAFILDRLVRFLGILIRAEAGGLRVILGGKAPKPRTP